MSLEDSGLARMSAAWRRLGVSLRQMTDVLDSLGEAAAKVPFPEGKVLRKLMLWAWRRDKGILRFLYLGWWQVVLSGKGQSGRHKTIRFR